jgi:surface antigen
MCKPEMQPDAEHTTNSIPHGIAVCTLLLALQACSLGANQALLESEPQIITSSVTRPVKADGIDSSDAEAIKSAVANAVPQKAPDLSLAWSNPDTGNHGTIMAIEKYVGSHGQQCKKFRTTVDSFKGVSLYNGEACEVASDSWVLSWFLREEG